MKRALAILVALTFMLGQGVCFGETSAIPIGESAVPEMPVYNATAQAANEAAVAMAEAADAAEPEDDEGIWMEPEIALPEETEELLEELAEAMEDILAEDECPSCLGYGCTCCEPYDPAEDDFGDDMWDTDEPLDDSWWDELVEESLEDDDYWDIGDEGDIIEELVIPDDGEHEIEILVWEEEIDEPPVDTDGDEEPDDLDPYPALPGE